MKRIRDLIDWWWERNDMFEMSNVPPRMTGLRYTVWIDKNDGHRHGPRVKVYLGNSRDKRDLLVVTIADDPQVKHAPRYHVAAWVIEHVRAFVLLNEELLLQFWNDREMAPDEFFARVRKIG